MCAARGGGRPRDLVLHLGTRPRKSHSVSLDSRCVMSVSLPFGLVEGTAERVVDGARLQAVAEAFAVHG